MAIIDVIKYEGNNCLVWKHPKEDYNKSAQLIVHESQEAIVFKNGKASEPYSEGKYTLDSENIPVVKYFRTLVTGGISPYHYEVYFINKNHAMDICWATSSPMTVQDPAWQVPFHMRANGQLVVQVADSRKLLLKLVGTAIGFTQYTLKKYFRGLLMSRIKSYITDVMSSQPVSILNINKYLDVFSAEIKEKIGSIFYDYGLDVVDFFFESINIEEDEEYQQLRAAMAERATGTMLGMDKITKESFEVAKLQASNPGTAGQMQQLFTGAAAGAAMAPAINNMVGNAIGRASNAVAEDGHIPKRDPFSMGVVPSAQTSLQQEDKPMILCPQCSKTVPVGSVFCNHCGQRLMQEETMVECPVCGKNLPAGSKFCNACGGKIEES